MISPTLLQDLLVFGAQVACIVTLGALVLAVIRVDAAGVRYGFLRTLLALCLLLPWIQVRQAAPSGAAGVTVNTSFIAVGGGRVPMALEQGLDWTSVLGTLLLGGMAMRTAWIALGLVRLGRLRRAGCRLPQLQDHDELQRTLGTRADIRYVAGLRQPVTFGVWRPVVLLPDVLHEHPLHVQRAVLSHELLHVQRRDWLWLVGEEAVRAVLWFHPGVWWLVSRIQLAREEVVDELAMLATGTRRGYLEALATFADETPLVPAAAFARRRHLLRRMQLISKGATMSSTRIALSCAAMALVVAVGSLYTIRTFPLLAAGAQDVRTEVGPLERRAKPITPENPVPRRIRSVDPEYPPDAAAINASAMVILLATIDESGRVGEMRRIGIFPTQATTGDPQTTLAALESILQSAADAVRQWEYDAPADGPITIRVSLSFSPDGQVRLVGHDGWSGQDAGRFTWFGTAGSATGIASAVSPEPALPGSAFVAPGGATVSLFSRGQPVAAGTFSTAPLRVGSTIRQPTKTKHVNPLYPQEAQDAHVQGVVILEAVIGPDGKVSSARVLRSVPQLDQAAMDAVMQWEFTPTMLNGQPVPVVMTLTVQFTLSSSSR